MRLLSSDVSSLQASDTCRVAVFTTHFTDYPYVVDQQERKLGSAQGASRAANDGYGLIMCQCDGNDRVCQVHAHLKALIVQK